MRRLAVIGAALVVAGCGGGPSIAVTDLPPECAGDSAGLLKALDRAPRQVLVDGEPISHCLLAGASAAEVQLLGTSLVTAAQQLGGRAAGDAHAAVELGYLIGAARRGSRRNGVTAELVRRLEAETGALGSHRAAYARGLRAGSATG